MVVPKYPAMKFSVIVPSYNGSSTIRECLASLLAQQRPADEIIVVDSSEDETPSIIENEFPQVRLIRREQQTSCGMARNIGVDHSSGDIVAFTDTDCIATPQWLACLERTYQEFGCHCAVGGVGGPEDESWVAKMDRAVSFSEQFTTGPPRWLKQGIGGGLNLSMRREIYLELGGCHDWKYGEDVPFIAEFRRRYGQVLFIPSARVLHISPNDISKVLAHQYRAGHGFAYARLYNPALAGSLAVRHTCLAPLLPIVKGSRVLLRLLKYDRRLLGTVLAHFPTFVRALWLWTAGMLAGVREVGEVSKRNQ